MQLNQNAKKQELFMFNPEGGIGYKMPDDLTLFLLAINFKLKNSFYFNAKDKMNSLENLIDKVNDFEYKMALAKYASSVLGIRLSPVIILTREALKMKINGEDNNYKKELIKRVSAFVFDRPDKIANASAYTTYMTNESIKFMPAFFKRALKDALERLSINNLNKYKLKRRSVKLADLIKVLRPKPNNKAKAQAFKGIIENELALEKDIKVVLSNADLGKEEKEAQINNMAKDIPINAFIKNLRNIPETEDNINILKKKLTAVLQIEEGLPGLKVINPFDVLVAGIECGKKGFTKVISDLLEQWTKKINLGLEGKKVSILVDVSGSMSRERLEVVSKYFSLMFAPLYSSDIRLYSFNTHVENKTQLVKGFGLMNPLAIRESFLQNFKAGGGTSLADSIKSVYNSDKPDLLIVFSDEVSWADKNETYISSFDVPGNIIAINPDVVSNFSAFSTKKPNLIKVSGLDAKILYYIPLLGNFNTFKKYLKSLL